MKTQWASIAAASLMLLFSAPSGAAPDAAAFNALAKKKGCFNCHRTDQSVLGPSLRDIGKKYSGDAGAEGKLADIIKHGSKGGVWGNAAMPAYARLSDKDIKLLAQFILSLK
jgi:cytochrome c